MKKQSTLLCILLAGWLCNTQAQETQATVKALETYALKDTTQGWKLSGISGVTFGQTSLHNWSAGGNNTVSANAFFNASANYLKNNWFWDNNLLAEYGMIYSSAYDWQKAADKLNFKSVAGLGISSKWSASALFNFATQFTKGYKYPDIDRYISTFMAPAYADAALGFTYKPVKNYTLFISPVAERATFVLNDSLSSTGAFGVEPGKKIKWETGAYLTATANQALWDNVNIISTLNLFTPYNQNFGNVDVNWDILISFKLHKLLTANLNTTLRYYGSESYEIQFKEIFGLGVTYQF